MDPQTSLAGQGPNASRRAYNVRDIRRRIFALLDIGDLARCMRIERGGMRDIAEVLYEEVKFDTIWSDLSETNSNYQLYYDCVKIVDAQEMTINDSMFDQLGPSHSNDPYHDGDERAGYMENFNEGLFNLVVPVLRRRCKGLKKIMFGWQYQPLAAIGASWDVIMQQGSALSDPDTPHPQIDSGYIDHVKYISLSLDENPPTEDTWAPNPPSPGYTVRSSMDLTIYGVEPLPNALSQRWITALRDHPIFANIYGGVDLSILPCSLDLLERIYEHQEIAGNAGCLTHLKSANISPFDIHEFHRFSTIASNSLFLLRLVRDEYGIGDDVQARISFSDLPTFIDTIRTNLPNLRHLGLAISGIETAEKVCKGLLEEDGLNDGGTIYGLDIRVSHSSTSLFNVIRCFAPLLIPDARIDFEGLDSLVWPPLCQTGYHKYLRLQTPERKKYLSTVNFSSLDITQPREVLELTYNHDNTPRRRMQDKGLKWAKQIITGGKTAAQDNISKLVLATLDTAASTNQLLDVLATAAPTHAELLAGTEKVLDAAVRAEAALLVMRNLFEVGRVSDLQQTVESLRKLVATAEEEE